MIFLSHEKMGVELDKLMSLGNKNTTSQQGMWEEFEYGTCTWYFKV